MTYSNAWKLTQETTYQQAIVEEWGDEWLIADEHIRIADYDLSNGIIENVTDYDN